MALEPRGIHTVQLEVLKGIDFIKTDLSSIKEELITFIKNDPEYSSTWDNFYDSDSGKILLDTFSFLMRKLLVRVDIQANETFPSTAQQEGNILKVLRLIGHELRSYSEATVFIDVKFPTVRPNVTINLGAEYALPATNTEGAEVKFYIRNNQTDYFNSVIIPLDIDGKAKEGLILKAYSGELTVDKIDRSTIITGDNEIYTLNAYPVNQGSIRVFYIGNDNIEYEALEVNSFFNVPDTEARVPFIVRYDENQRASVVFGSNTLVKVLPDKKDITIYYTIGGGQVYNIVEKSINFADTFSTPTFLNANSVTVEFSNLGKGFGGKEPETVEEAQLTAPLALRTIDRTVTEQDYEILLRQQGSILHSRVLSPNDNRDYFPFDSKIPLFHVWIYVTLNRQINNMDDLLLTKQVREKTGTLIGGDSYDILQYLKTRRIVGIENVLKPSIYTRLFFRIKIRYNPIYDISVIENDSRDIMENTFSINNTGYERIIRSTTVKSKLKRLNGVVDIYISEFKRQKFIQRLAPVNSNYFFNYTSNNPSIDNVETEDDFGQYYEASFNEVIFILDSSTDVVFEFEQAEKLEVL